jgi:hypothetical protein
MMAKTHKSTWKRRERQAPLGFGVKRQRCSGSSGRADCSRSDSTHPTLFLETKLRTAHAAVALLDATRRLAKKEGKVPVVALASKGRPGLVLVLAIEDLAVVAREYEKVNALPADTDPPPGWPSYAPNADDLGE